MSFLMLRRNPIYRARPQATTKKTSNSSSPTSTLSTFLRRVPSPSGKGRLPIIGALRTTKSSWFRSRMRSARTRQARNQSYFNILSSTVTKNSRSPSYRVKISKRTTSMRASATRLTVWRSPRSFRCRIRRMLPAPTPMISPPLRSKIIKSDTVKIPVSNAPTREIPITSKISGRRTRAASPSLSTEPTPRKVRLLHSQVTMSRSTRS